MTRRLVVDLAAPRVAFRLPVGATGAIRGALGPEWEVVEVSAPAPSDGDGGSGSAEAARAARGAEIYLGFGIPAAVVEAGRGTLRWAHSATAGVAASIAPLRDREVMLTNSAGVYAEPMADWVLAAVAYFTRGLDHQLAAQRAGRWAKREIADLLLPMRELAEVRVGLFGLGGVGAAVARRVVALGMPVAALRARPALGGPPGLRWVGGPNELPRLAAEIDCLVVAAPETPRTRGVVGRAVLERLPAGAMVVNVSRGMLLDEAAVLDLLDRGHLRGVALDVFAREPLPADHAFWRHPRVLVSPHTSAVSARFGERELALILENIRRYLEGMPLRNVVVIEAGY